MKAIVLAVATSCCLSFSAHTQEWTKSKWGPDDKIGAANLITPESVLSASKLIKTGKTYNLGIILDKNKPTFGPRSMSITILQPTGLV